MRTVVFSDERVALAFNARFVSVWENHAPNVRFSDDPPKPEKYLYRRSGELLDLPLGTGGTNVISIFATPDGQVLNAVPGYLDAESLFDEMRLALAVKKLTLDRNGKPLPGASRSYEGLHQAAARAYGPSVPATAHETLARRGRGLLGRRSWNDARSTSVWHLFDPPRPASDCGTFACFDRARAKLSR